MLTSVAFYDVESTIILVALRVGGPGGVDPDEAARCLLAPGSRVSSFVLVQLYEVVFIASLKVKTNIATNRQHKNPYQYYTAWAGAETLPCFILLVHVPHVALCPPDVQSCF